MPLLRQSPGRRGRLLQVREGPAVASGGRGGLHGEGPDLRRPALV